MLVLGEVVVFSAKCQDCRNRAELIESMTPCHDAQMVGSFQVWSPHHLTILAAKSENDTIAAQHLQSD